MKKESPQYFYKPLDVLQSINRKIILIYIGKGTFRNKDTGEEVKVEDINLEDFRYLG